MIDNDEWYDSEPLTRRGFVTELQRIKMRTLVRPIPVLLIAALVTGFIVHRQIKKQPLVEAQVVLALAEEGAHQRTTTIPVDALREYVLGVLLPDAKLLDLIERRHLSRLRAKLGDQFAIDEVRDALDVVIWKNSFIYYDEEDENSQKSARIGLTVTGADADEAFDLARDLAGIVIETADEQRQQVADALTKQYTTVRDSISLDLENIQRAIAVKKGAMENARRSGQMGLAAVFLVDLAHLSEEETRATAQLANLVNSPDRIASELTAAGMDMSLTVVDEHRPEPPPKSGLVLVMIAMVVGTGALVGASLVVGAFDGRVHDADDVARLGLPVLGHVPGFKGDRVGSLEARGAARARVPLFRRWRSHR